MGAEPALEEALLPNSAKNVRFHGNSDDHNCVDQSEVFATTGPGDLQQLHKTQKTIYETVQDDAFGSKTIDTLGGFALLVNNVTGPALVLLPLVFQQAGLVPTSLALLLVGAMSAFSSVCLAEAMARYPGNEHFEGRVEFTYLARHFLPPWGYWLSLGFLIFSLQATIISSIVLSSQTMDEVIIHFFGQSCALELSPDLAFVCISTAGSSDSPFGSLYVISLGFLVVLVLTVPFGFFNLDDNIIVQKVAFFGLLVCFLDWMFAFADHGFTEGTLKAFGSDSSELLGIVLFNYSFVVSIPSWINEKKKSVRIDPTVYGGIGFSTVLFFLVGILGALSFNFLSTGQDVLVALARSPSASLFTKICVYTFPIFALQTGIPIYSIIIRYNLLENKLCSRATANFWAGVFPWVLSLVFLRGNLINAILNYSSLFINIPLNFLIPYWILYEARKRVEVSLQPIQPLRKVPGDDAEASTTDPEDLSGFEIESRIGGSKSRTVSYRIAGTRPFIQSKVSHMAVGCGIALLVVNLGYLVAEAVGVIKPA